MDRKKKRDVVVVAMKLTTGGRELLTWTLAKFSKPGDEVVALHIAEKQHFTSPVDADPKSYAVDSNLSIGQRGLEDIIDSVTGVYSGFCTAKDVKLRTKVINSCLSVRKTLVDEVKHQHAIQLILGAPVMKCSSLGLASYCYTHLPSTCCVMVIQHGLVVVAKAGKIALADGSKKQGQVIRDMTTGQGIVNKARRNCKVPWQDKLGKSLCLQCPSTRTLDNSGYTLHPYKYVPACMQGLQTCISELEKLSTMVAIRGSQVNCSVPRILSCSSNNFYSKDCGFSMESEEIQLSHETKDIGKLCSSLDSLQGIKNASNRCKWGWPLVMADWKSDEPFPAKLSLGLETPKCTYSNIHESPKISNEGTQKVIGLQNRRTTSETLHGWPRTTSETQKVTGLQNRRTTSETLHGWPCTTSETLQGWPLLNRSKTASKSDNFLWRSRKTSVLEWVYQLPERPQRQFEQISLSNEKQMHKGSEATNKKTYLEACYQDKRPFVAELDFKTGVANTFFGKCQQLCRGSNIVAFCFAVLEKSTNGFSKDNIIGKGGCSRVYRGVLSGAHIVAIKWFDKCLAWASDNEFLTELEIVSSLHHHYIIQLLGYCIDDQQHRCLVYSYATEGSLEQKLHHDSVAVLPWSVRYKVALGIGEALEYLHKSAQPPVIHRDVKSSNILLQADFTPQLADFGLSQWASTCSTFSTCSDVVGTFGYLAPEYFMFGKVSDKTDVYSFGVVLLELISGRHPINHVGSNGYEKLISKAKQGVVDKAVQATVVDERLRKEYDSDELQSMLSAVSLCLQHSPHLRPSMSQILNVLRGELSDLEMKQDSMSVDGFSVPWGGDRDIHNHLTLALCGVENDPNSEAGVDETVGSAKGNKLMEEYLRGRCG